MAKVYRQCYLCGRVGHRGFHQNILRDDKPWRCDSTIACDNRRYRRFMGLK